MIINPESNQCDEKLYTVSLNTGLAWLQEYSVYAYNEQEAVDLVADYLEAEELTGLYSDHYTLADLCEAGETPDEYAEANNLSCAGNHGIYISIAGIKEELNNDRTRL